MNDEGIFDTPSCLFDSWLVLEMAFLDSFRVKFVLRAPTIATRPLFVEIVTIEFVV